MSDPQQEYFQGLKKFKHLMLFSNAVHDRTVPFYTSFIADKDPFEEAGLVDEIYFELPPLLPGSAVDTSTSRSTSSSNLKTTFKCEKRDSDQSETSSTIEQTTKDNSCEQIDSDNAISQSSTTELDYINVPMFLDMKRSRFEGSNPKAPPSPQERQLRRYMMFIAPLTIPIMLAVTTVSTAISYYRVHEFTAASKGWGFQPALEVYSKNSHLLLDSEDKQLHQHRDGEHHRIGEMTADAMDDVLLLSTEAQGEPPQGSAVIPITTGTQIEPALGNGYQGLLASTPKTLNLTAEQKRIFDNLNELPWEKFAVKLQRMHSHAEIINRRNQLGQGSRILSFWANHLETKFEASVAQQ
jgi:hypothetical protein